MDFRLRAYTAEDLSALVELDTACFTSEFLFDRELMQHFAEAPNAITVIAETSEGILAGFVIAHNELKSGTRRSYVLTLDVAVESRRKGLAGLLMDAVERQAGREGSAWMDLHVYASNAAAILFYEGYGYQRQARRRNFYGPGLDAYMYRKELHAPAGK